MEVGQARGLTPENRVEIFQKALASPVTGQRLEVARFHIGGEDYATVASGTDSVGYTVAYSSARGREVHTFDKLGKHTSSRVSVGGHAIAPIQSNAPVEGQADHVIRRFTEINRAPVD